MVADTSKHQKGHAQSTIERFKYINNLRKSLALCALISEMATYNDSRHENKTPMGCCCEERFNA
jgi:hypothetical protein